MRVSSILGVAIVSCAAYGPAAAAQTKPALPPNDVNCKDWTHNPDGSWTAGPYAAHVRSMTVGPGVHIIVGGRYDLLQVLNGKCAGKQ